MRPSAAFAEGLGALSSGMALSGKMMMALRTGNETNLQSRRLRTQEQLPHMKNLKPLQAKEPVQGGGQHGQERHQDMPGLLRRVTEGCKFEAHERQNAPGKI